MVHGPHNSLQVAAYKIPTSISIARRNQRQLVNEIQTQSTWYCTLLILYKLPNMQASEYCLMHIFGVQWCWWLLLHRMLLYARLRTITIFAMVSNSISIGYPKVNRVQAENEAITANILQDKSHFCWEFYTDLSFYENEMDGLYLQNLKRLTIQQSILQTLLNIAIVFVNIAFGSRI